MACFLSSYSKRIGITNSANNITVRADPDRGPGIKLGISLTSQQPDNGSITGYIVLHRNNRPNTYNYIRISGISSLSLQI